MTGREARHLEALKKLYVVSSTQIPKKIPNLPKQFSIQTVRLGKTLAELDELQAIRVSSGPFQRGRAKRDHTITMVMDEFLKPMRRIARVHSSINPQFATSFVVPRPRSAIRDFVVAARDFAQATEPHQSIFADGGMEDDFIEQLRSLADQLEAQAGVTAVFRLGRGEVARDVRSLLKGGRSIAVLLDTILRRHCARLRNHPGNDTTLLAGLLEMWTRAMHVERDPVRKARRLKPVL